MVPARKKRGSTKKGEKFKIFQKINSNLNKMQEMTALMEHYRQEHVHSEEEFHTFAGLNLWYHKLVSEFGFVILTHHEGHHKSIHVYLESIAHFCKAVECKCKETQSPDKQQDLLIMHHKIKILKMKIIKMFGFEKMSPCAM